jgi:hypothetical protein
MVSSGERYLLSRGVFSREVSSVKTVVLLAEVSTVERSPPGRFGVLSRT